MPSSPFSPSTSQNCRVDYSSYAKSKLINGQGNLYFNWCLKRQTLSTYASTCTFQLQQSGSIASYGTGYNIGSYKIKSRGGKVKYSSSISPPYCTSVDIGDTLTWTAKSQTFNHQLCFSPTPCTATTTARTKSSSWIGNTWYYWGPFIGIFVTMFCCVNIMRQRRRRMLRMEQARLRNVANTVTITNLVERVPPQVVNNSPAPVVATSHPAEFSGVAYPVATPMPAQAIPQPMAQAVAQPVPQVTENTIPQAVAQPVAQVGEQVGEQPLTQAQAVARPVGLPVAVATPVPMPHGQVDGHVNTNHYAL